MDDSLFSLSKYLFNKYLNGFDDVFDDIRNRVFREECYTGYFYNPFPFYYQRFGFKKGKLVKNMKDKGKYIYGLDRENKVVSIKEAADLEGEYSKSCIYYDDSYDVLVNYDYDDELVAVSIYFKGPDKKYIKMESKGQEGSIVEFYFYNQNNLEKIEIRQFDAQDNFVNKLYHELVYEDNELKEIYKYPENKSYRKKIYP